MKRSAYDLFIRGAIFFALVGCVIWTLSIAGIVVWVAF